MDEKELVRCALTNREAFGEIINLHYQEVFNYIYKRTLNKEVSEDLTQETFFKALKYLNSFRCDCPLIFWLLRIAINLINAHFRKEIKNSKLRKDLSRTFLDKSNASPCDCTDYAFLYKYIRELSPAQQAVITSIHFENRTMKETALIIGKSVAYTRIIYHKALNNLRRKMKKDIKNF